MTYYRNAKYKVAVDLAPFREFIAEHERFLDAGTFDESFGRDAYDGFVMLRFSDSIYTEGERTVHANQEPVTEEVAAVLAEAEMLIERAKALSSIFRGRNRRKP